MDMGLGDALRDLAALTTVIDETSADVIEAGSVTVADDGDVKATIAVEIPADEAGQLANRTPQHESTVDEEAGRVDSEASPDSSRSGPTAADETDEAVAENGATARGSEEDDRGGDEAPSDTNTENHDDGGVDSSAADGTGEFECTVDGCGATFDSEHGMHIHRSKAHTAADDHDPETLERVYDRNDSFAAMREALQVDVSVQTVRRWMIKHDIHRPSAQPGHSEAALAHDGDAEADTDDARPADGEPARPSDTAGEPSMDPSTASQPEVEQEPATDPAPGSQPEAEQEPKEQAETAAQDDHEMADHASAAPAADEPGEEATRHDAETDESTAEAVSEPEVAADEQHAVVAAALPEGVSVAEFRTAVDAASTLYEVQDRLGLEREQAKQLLAKFDLLELVHGRVADKHRREELKDEIDERLRMNAPAADTHSV